MPAIDRTQRTAAWIAGASGLFGFLIVVFANYTLLDPLIVPHDAANTARNFIAHQTQARVALVCFLAYSASVIALLSALYTVFRPVDRMLALLGALLRLAFALLWGVFALNLLAALRLLGDTPYLGVLQPAQLQTLARLNIAAGFDDYYVGLPFFGLAATICAFLWFKSRYLPRALSAFGVVASGWCVVCAFVFLVFPDFDKIVNAYWFDSPMAIFELIVSFWLVTRGLPADGSLAAATAR
jgi:hypothetical protein